MSEDLHYAKPLSCTCGRKGKVDYVIRRGGPGAPDEPPAIEKVYGFTHSKESSGTVTCECGRRVLGA